MELKLTKSIMDHEKILKHLQEQVDYCCELNRRATFKTWVFSDRARCSAAKLAEAGFIFTGSKTDPDSVKCFLCNKSLDCWEEDDDPWAEHQKHSKHCLFANLDKPEKALTLLEFIDVKEELIKSVLKKIFTEQLQQVNAQFDELVQVVKRLK